MDKVLASPLAQARRESLLAAAFDVFGRLGYQATAMADVARAAGMSRPAVYQHVADKAALCAAVVAQEYRQAAERMAQALAPAVPTATALALAFAARGDRLDRLPQDLPAAAREAVTQGRAALEQVLATWLAAEVAEGRLTLPGGHGDVRAVARVILSARDGLGRSGRDRQEATLARLIGRGLAVRAG